jgi:hypothetical protein
MSTIGRYTFWLLSQETLIKNKCIRKSGYSERVYLSLEFWEEISNNILLLDFGKSLWINPASCHKSKLFNDGVLLLLSFPSLILHKLFIYKLQYLHIAILTFYTIKPFWQQHNITWIKQRLFLLSSFFFFFVGLWSQLADKLTIYSIPCSWIL